MTSPNIYFCKNCTPANLTKVTKTTVMDEAVWKKVPIGKPYAKRNAKLSRYGGHIPVSAGLGKKMTEYNITYR